MALVEPSERGGMCGLREGVLKDAVSIYFILPGLNQLFLLNVEAW